MGATDGCGRWASHHSSEAADGVDAAVRAADDGRSSSRDGGPPRSRSGRLDFSSAPAPAATQNSGSQVAVAGSPRRPP